MIAFHKQHHGGTSSLLIFQMGVFMDLSLCESQTLNYRFQELNEKTKLFGSLPHARHQELY